MLLGIVDATPIRRLSPVAADYAQDDGFAKRTRRLADRRRELIRIARTSRLRPQPGIGRSPHFHSPRDPGLPRPEAVAQRK
jgi:hypothetical protein